MDAELQLEVSSFDSDVGLVLEAVPSEVVGLFLLVVLIVRSHDIDLLSQST